MFQKSNMKRWYRWF